MYLPIDETLSTAWLVFGLVLTGISLILVFIPRVPASVVGYMALWAAKLSGYTPFTTGTMIFWGVAVLIVLVNRFLLPSFVRNSSRGIGYIGVGAIVGMSVGLIMYTAASVIIGAIVGAFLGAIAYTRTSAGATLEFPTSKFFNYLGAKAIPVVITVSMSGLVFAGLITRHLLLN